MHCVFPSFFSPGFEHDFLLDTAGFGDEFACRIGGFHSTHSDQASNHSPKKSPSRKSLAADFPTVDTSPVLRGSMHFLYIYIYIFLDLSPRILKHVFLSSSRCILCVDFSASVFFFLFGEIFSVASVSFLPPVSELSNHPSWWTESDEGDSLEFNMLFFF